MYVTLIVLATVFSKPWYKLAGGAHINNSLNFAQKYAQIFVHGNNLFGRSEHFSENIAQGNL